VVAPASAPVVVAEPVVETAEPIAELTVELVETPTTIEPAIEPVAEPAVIENEPGEKPSTPDDPGPGNGEPDIGALSIRALRELDLAGRDLESLMRDEQAGKHRRTILAHLRLEQRKQAAVSPASPASPGQVT